MQRSAKIKRELIDVSQGTPLFVRLLICSMAVIVFTFLLCTCTYKDTISPLPISLLSPCGGHVISGYTDKTSYLPGEEVRVFIQSTSTFQCGLRIYDINGDLKFSFDASLV